MATGKIRRFVCAAIIFLLISPSFARTSFIIDRSQYQLLQKMLNRYYQIAAEGGWGKIKLDKKYYMRGESGPVVQQIKKRLEISGDYRGNDNSPLFTDELAEAVKKLRKQFGLPAIGSVDAALVKQLNVPVETRIAQLKANMDRLQKLKIEEKGTQLVANIPEFKLHVYENGKEVFDMDIVVGKSSTKTETFTGMLSHIVFSPYWNVPESIVLNEILPAARKNKNYLKSNGYEVLGNKNGLPVIRQKPGEGNSLGRVKFVFPNSHSIYFHDTPAKSLFKMDKRAYSHGCIRLAEPAKLAQYLMKNDPSWSEEKIKQAMEKGKEQWVKLDAAVPVAIVYITAWVDEEGGLNFREDIYRKDS